MFLLAPVIWCTNNRGSVKYFQQLVLASLLTKYVVGSVSLNMCWAMTH